MGMLQKVYRNKKIWLLHVGRWIIGFPLELVLHIGSQSRVLTFRAAENEDMFFKCLSYHMLRAMCFVPRQKNGTVWKLQLSYYI